MRPTHSQSPTARGAFTIVEILVVIALVLVLLSLVVVAVGSATRSAQRTNTVALMNSISQGLIHFREDVGYLPPVLDTQRNIRWADLDDRTNGPDPTASATYESQIQDWYSITSLAEYLIGYGDETEDGYDGPGIRNPGTDGFWGATVSHGPIPGQPGTFEYRRAYFQSDISTTARQGQVYGPYLQLRDERLLGAVAPGAEANANGNYQVFFPGEAGYDASWPKVIVDYWGEPIRYYRKPYPLGGINRGYRAVRQSGDDFRAEPPTLADIYLLRPWQVRGSEIDTRFSDEADDTTATLDLQSAEFGLFSSGPDRRFDQRYRVDRETEFNQDNIVELGQ